jgi:mannose-6-phosphate isomerase-like protein (cupin superfamily)
MNSSTLIRTFDLQSTRVNIDRAGAAFVSDTGAAARAHPDHRAFEPAGGHTLCAYAVARNEDLHPELWEIHPAGDEVFLMCSGALDVVTRLEGEDTSTTLNAGQGLVVPQGVWHRLALRKPGLLVVLVPRAGTRLSAVPL